MTRSWSGLFGSDLARFTDFVLDVASSRQTLNEQHAYHEIAIFKSGITL